MAGVALERKVFTRQPGLLDTLPPRVGCGTLEESHLPGTKTGPTLKHLSKVKCL